MRKLRVLHIYRTYFPETQGGLQESIRQLCLATKEYAVENTIFALARDPNPAVLNLPEGTLIRAKSWFEIASCDFGGVGAIYRCREAAKSCDIIQIHFPWPFADLMLPFIRSKEQPVVVTYVSDIVRQRGLEALYAPLRNRLLKAADRVVASTANYVNSSEILGAYSKKLVCIPHCLAEAPAEDTNVRDRWETSLGRDFFLFVGVMRYYKGLDYLLAAAAKVKSQIVIAGEGPEGDQLRQVVAANRLDNVHILGAIPDADKFALFSLCRAVVFPSHLRSEAFGMTLLEGARAAKPLISCEIGTGTSWINAHNETGLVVAPADSDALADAMNFLAANDALCIRLGVAAQHRWASHFSAAQVGRAYRNLYEDLLPLTSPGIPLTQSL